MKKTIQTLLPTIVFCTILISCSKQGPVGATGTTGPAGSTGAAGATGAKGDTGTANVIYSAWITATNFKDSTIDGTDEQIATLTAPSLTSGDLDSATLMVYFTFGAGIFPLPYTSYAGGKASTISFIPNVGSITITRMTVDNSASITLGTNLQYRFVIIPGGVSVPDAWDYATVSSFYHISIP